MKEENTMNREERVIKFRAWDIVENKMDYRPSVSVYEGGHVWLNPALNQKLFVFMQFTGLLDKNGKEIYEGDILKFNTLSGNTMVYQVSWRKKGFGPDRMSEHNQAEMEVIGNKYENPELVPILPYQKK